VYLNRFEDAPLVWSVDRGTKATEQRFSSVILAKVDGVSRLNLDADNVSEPRCWIEVRSDMLAVMGSVAIVGPNGQSTVDLARLAQRELEQMEAGSL
jgi:hypothetical protein